MFKINVELLDKGTLFRFKKAKRAFRKEMFEAIAETMDKIRYHAARDEIIQNNFLPDIINPRILRRLQPATSGRLTSRTGKLKWILLERLMGTNFGKGYSGVTIYKLILHGLAIRIRETSPGNTISATFQGEMRNEIIPHSRIFSTGFKFKEPSGRWNRNKSMPQETNESILARFNWDREGIIKRGGKRPFLSTAANKHLNSFNTITDRHVNIISQILNGYI
jgi:hypothetical protein